MASKSSTPKLDVIERLKRDLRMNPRKRILLLGLMPLMVAVWVPVLRGGSSPDHPPQTTASASVSPGAEELPPPEPIDLELRSELKDLVSRLGEEWTPSWKGKEDERPFRMPGGGVDRHQRGGPGENGNGPTKRVTPEEEEALAATLHPTSTFISDKGGNLAIIGGENHRVGDRIEHFVIREIRTRAVVLEGRFGEYELSIPLEKEGRR